MLIIRLAVDEHEAWPDVAVAITFPFAGESMVVKSLWQGQVGGQQGQSFTKQVVELRSERRGLARPADGVACPRRQPRDSVACAEDEAKLSDDERVWDIVFLGIKDEDATEVVELGRISRVTEVDRDPPP
jgi:hypothetical protein